MKKIAVLGSTGSVGRTTIDVVCQSNGRYAVESLAANKNWKLLAEQVEKFSPARVALSDAASADAFRKEVGDGIEIHSGPGALEEIVRASSADLVVSAVSGAAGLVPTLAAVDTGRNVALANKESIVMAGPTVMAAAAQAGGTIIPVDSEHSAIFQVMKGEDPASVRRIILTASGGPFRTASMRTMARVTPREALEHPTWSMGIKITIDSATMMNKALEIVEARWLFDLDVSQIDVVIHPESVVHSLVEFRDGSTIAQVGHPDMRIPVRFALSYPEREDADVKGLDLPSLGKLTFYSPDIEKFPALRLGYTAAKAGGTMGAVMNGANEVAVRAFLEGQIGFLDIVEIVEEVMKAHKLVEAPDMEKIMEADAWTRKETRECILNR